MAPNRKPARTVGVSPVSKHRTNLRQTRRRSQSVPALNCGDITFLVGRQKRPYVIHSFLLSLVSDVFKVLFTPAWFSDVIEISDVEPKAFEILREFLYLRHKRGGPIVQATETEPDIKLFLNAYYLGHKYNISSFLSYLEESVSSLVNAENVLETLIHADLFQSSRLRSYCWSYIERNTTKVVNSANFPHLPWDQFCDILENNRLTIREYDLFQGVIRWCRAHSHHGASGNKMYEVIGVAIYKIRFPLMTRQEFQLVIQSGILKLGEILDLESNFHRNQMFVNRRRKNVCQCRSNKIPCSLCTICPQNTTLTKSLDGKVIDSTSHLIHQTTEFFEAYENWYKGSAGNCECAKYASCPAFPNGATNILRDSIMRNRSERREKTRLILRIGNTGALTNWEIKRCLCHFD